MVVIDLEEQASSLSKIHSCTFKQAREILWMGLSYDKAKLLFTELDSMDTYLDSFNSVKSLLYNSIANSTHDKKTENYFFD